MVITMLVSAARRNVGTVSHSTTPENPKTVDQNTQRTRWRCSPVALTKVVVSTPNITISATINDGKRAAYNHGTKQPEAPRPIENAIALAANNSVDAATSARHTTRIRSPMTPRDRSSNVKYNV